ncbi:MAG: hypothetical protein ACLTXL_17415, partial [Clostridia bacterium]
MHAGEAKNDCVQRAHSDKFLHSTFETTMPAVKRHSKCTPASSLPNICRSRTILFPTVYVLFIEQAKGPLSASYKFRFRFLYKGIIIKHNKTEPT